MLKAKNEFNKKTVSIIAPIAFQQFLLAAVGAGDSLMLGFVNGDAMAAVSLAANIEFAENLLLSAFVVGATVLTSQYFGKGDIRAIERIFGLVLKYAMVISLLFAVAAVLFPEKLIGLFTNEPELIAIGTEYIQPAVGTYLLTGITQCYLCIMKTTGQTKQSVFISTFAIVLDTVLNAVFIFGFHMEAAGAALTTSVTRFIELITVLIYAEKMIVKPDLFARISRNVHKDFLKCSIPHLINSMLWGMGTTTYAAIMGHLGTAETTAYSAVLIIRNLSVSFCRGLSQGTEIILSNVLGAGKLKTAKKLGKKFSKFSVLCGVLCGAFTLAVGPILSRFMTLSDDARNVLRVMIYISVFYVIVQCISMVVVCGIFTAGGDTAFDAYSVALTMWIVIIPLALMAAFFWKLTPLAVYFIISLDEVVKLPWIYAHYKKYKWVRNITREETL